MRNEKLWVELCEIAEKFAKENMNPHQTIIITQNGIELLDGAKAKPFKVVD